MGISILTFLNVYMKFQYIFSQSGFSVKNFRRDLQSKIVYQFSRFCSAPPAGHGVDLLDLVGTGSFCIEGELVLNREKHPIYDTTNCIQGTYMM